jgi:uncharacterized protein DUF6886
VIAPPYRGEGRHALWHVSEEPGLRTFAPRDGRVWAVDTRHLPLYWFPRDCPRATWWAVESTTDEDVERWLEGDRSRRVHAIEPRWLQPMRDANVYAYRMPEPPFAPTEDERFYVSTTTVEALERVELGDLLQRHADARIELRIAPGLLALWDKVIDTTLDFSGIRLRNAQPA